MICNGAHGLQISEIVKQIVERGMPSDDLHCGDDRAHVLQLRKCGTVVFAADLNETRATSPVCVFVSSSQGGGGSAASEACAGCDDLTPD